MEWSRSRLWRHYETCFPISTGVPYDTAWPYHLLDSALVARPHVREVQGEQMSDLPAGMVTLGEAMNGFLTELEERCSKEGKADGCHEYEPSNRTSGRTAA